MSNYNKMIMWLKRSLAFGCWAIFPAFFSGIGGMILARPNLPTIDLVCGACCTFMVVMLASACIPCIIGLWFLFLHMIGQVASSIRGN